ncbi:MAG: hypothetical protein JWN17_2615, partial [Frankiales bacterium]|nr:hypothetical protein [Frankiales bacterium]
AAAAGDPVLAGRPNDATGAGTTLTGGTATEPTLALINTTTRAADGGAYGGPALRLPPAATGTLTPLGLDPSTATPGDLTSASDQLWYAHARVDDQGVVGSVYTSAFANHLAFVTPRRVLDTRRATAGTEGGAPNDGRANVVAGRFDAAGRLLAGTSLVLDLSGLLVGEQAGVLGNLTVVGPGSSGFLAAYPTPAGSLDTTGSGRPAVSSLNFVRGTPALANFALVAFEAGNRVSIYTTSLAHVLFDVVAFSVFDPFSTTEQDTARTTSDSWRGRRP